MGRKLPNFKMKPIKIAAPKLKLPVIKAPKVKIPKSLHKMSADMKKLAAKIVPPKKAKTSIVEAPAVAVRVTESRPQVSSVVQAPALTPAVVKDKTTVVAVPGVSVTSLKKPKVKGLDFPLLNGDNEMGYSRPGSIYRSRRKPQRSFKGHEDEMGYSRPGSIYRSRRKTQRSFKGHEDEMGFDDSMGFDFAALVDDLKKQVGTELTKAKAKLTTDVKARAGELVANAANKVLANPEIQAAMVTQGKEAAVKNIAENIASQITTQAAQTVATVKQYSKPIMIGGGVIGLLLAWKIFAPSRKAA
jgi:hypothetical protein